MSSWAKIAMAAAGSGGGSGGVTLNLNDLINPIGEHLYQVFSESSQIEMPGSASAYPSSWDQATFNAVMGADDAAVGWADSLEWRMAEDSWWPGDEMNWRLLVNWQWVYLPASSEAQEQLGIFTPLYLINNARATVDLNDSGWGWKLFVDARFDNPIAPGGIAAIPVWFHIKVSDGDGDVERDTWRGFEIRGDGTKREVQTTG